MNTYDAIEDIEYHAKILNRAANEVGEHRSELGFDDGNFSKLKVDSGQVIKLQKKAIEDNGITPSTPSLTETLEILDSDIRGFKIILPRRKKGYESHNNAVEITKKHLPQIHYLKRNGIFTPDNFVNGFLYAAIPIYAAASWILPEVIHPEIAKDMPNIAQIVGASVATIFGTISGGLLQGIFRSRDYYRQAGKAALKIEDIRNKK